MTPQTTFRVTDRRHTAGVAGPGAPRDIPPGYRPHAMLLGPLNEDQTRAFLLEKGAAPDAIDDLMRERARTSSRMRALPAYSPAEAVLPLQDAQAIAEIARIMELPECKAAFPPGSWTAQFVEIGKLIAVQPSIDVRYAEIIGAAGLDPENPISAVPLCFAHKHGLPFHVSLDQPQKSVSISGIHPAFEVLSLRCTQQQNDGPLIVSFMVAAPPNIVVVLRWSGRLFLSNGYHRIYRLMQAGFSHVPCVVREAPSLAHIAPYGPTFFQEPVLMAPRPPLFGDFADPELALIVPLRATRRVIRIRPDEYFVASP
ncbi:MAG: hypothetical protein JO328_17825 [Hyphomicrobiales bacterium]|nr:hypothetical protein [Hyphomicrobiales bacterium]MBV8824925.1 hypothetical protein [Hyphomicrobiales bacterium]MBV9429600.1 hypothetical protein [Bradyrhizobiaceae bacterium]